MIVHSVGVNSRPMARGPLSYVVADNVRLLCARRRVPQSVIAEHLGMSRMAVNDRFRYRTPWTVDELGGVAALFDVPVGVLLGEVAAPDVMRGGTRPPMVSAPRPAAGRRVPPAEPTLPGVLDRAG